MMLASELVQNIQAHIAEHGDLPISLTLSHKGQIIGSGEVFVGFDQRASDDEFGSRIDIRDFIY